MSFLRWLLNLLGCPPIDYPIKGYWICPDDWQTRSDCRFVNEVAPVSGVTEYYQSPFGLKPLYG